MNRRSSDGRSRQDGRRNAGLAERSGHGLLNPSAWRRPAICAPRTIRATQIRRNAPAPRYNPRVSATANSTLAQPVTALRGVGAERAALLARLGIHTVLDLLLHRPRRYEDRRDCRPIRTLTPGEAVLTGGTVVAAGVKRWKQGSRSRYEVILEDGTGRLHCRWWNLPFMEGRFAGRRGTGRLRQSTVTQAHHDGPPGDRDGGRG